MFTMFILMFFLQSSYVTKRLIVVQTNSSMYKKITDTVIFLNIVPMFAFMCRTVWNMRYQVIYQFSLGNNFGRYARKIAVVIQQCDRF